MQLSELPLYGIAVTFVLFGSGLVAFHHEAYSGEDRSDWFRRKWLGILLMGGGAVSLVLTIAASFD